MDRAELAANAIMHEIKAMLHEKVAEAVTELRPRLVAVLRDEFSDLQAQTLSDIRLE
jgi:hypothetical protein